MIGCISVSTKFGRNKGTLHARYTSLVGLTRLGSMYCFGVDTNLIRTRLNYNKNKVQKLPSPSLPLYV